MKPYLTLHHPAKARLYREQGLWNDDTFYGLLSRNASVRPDEVALEDGSKRLTWQELRHWVDGVAADLRIYGLIPGDRVSIWMSNRVEAIVTFLACSREGFACNPSLHRTFTCADVMPRLERLSAKALVTEPGWSANEQEVDVDAALARVESLRVVYTPDTFPRPGPNMTPPSADPDKVAYLAFTSGTTGNPKCVMHSDNTLLANARDLVRDWGHTRDTVIMSLSPVSHHIAWVAVAQWLLLGCHLVMDNPPKGMSRIDWITNRGVTYILGVPTHAIDILAEQRSLGATRLGSVKVFYMAGAQIPPSLAAEFIAQGIVPQNVYGMTENSSHQYTHPTDETDTIIGTCGRGGLAYQVRIFDIANPDREVPRGEVGQIGGQGAALMLGYFDNQSATEKSFNADGWFLSGDLGVMDGAGNLRIEGRLKDIIIRGGHNIYPDHIETLAIRGQGVEKAACFPVPDERLGERVCIAVVGDADPQDVLRHLATEGLSRYEMPEYFARVSDFPVNIHGKVLKRELIQMVERGDLAPQPIRFRLEQPNLGRASRPSESRV
ncbi:MAG: class I adenylate-forming enzyme family protein [Rhodopila sp.]|nr:class I adenylate-forming enzyme family protein [Rhodopila sp.]